MSGIVYFLAALLVFALIVFAHELGHYLAARWTGIRVLEFAIGFGPKLFSWRRKDIDYSLRVLPLGGYCKFEGEDESSGDPSAFTNAPVWKRFLTILAGPAMNFVLAYLALVVFFMFVGEIYRVPVVQEITSGMPAASSGLLPGDAVTAVNGEPIEQSDEGTAKFIKMIGESEPDKSVTLTVDRAGHSVDISVAPQETEDGGKIGILLMTKTRYYSFFQVQTLSVQSLISITRQMLDGFKGLIFHGEGAKDTMGPVGIISFMTEEIRRDFETIIYLIVIISLNVGIINLLPLPALDGGRLVFLAVEAVRRKPVKPEYEGWVHAAGFMLLMGLIAVLTYRDIARLVTGG